MSEYRTAQGRVKLGLWLDGQEDVVLERLAKVEPGKWDYWTGQWDESMPGVGCLLCHGFDIHDHGQWRAVIRNHPETHQHYCGLQIRFGDARVGEAISARARRVLDERNTSDLPVDAELVGPPSVPLHVRQVRDAREAVES